MKMLPPVQSRNDLLLRRILAGVLVVVVIFMTARYYDKASEGRSAVVRWRPQVEATLQGENLYQQAHRVNETKDDFQEFPLPPLMVMVLSPLQMLGPVSAAMLFYVVKLGLACVGVWWALRIASGGARLPDWAGAVAIAMSASPILGDLEHGNTNILVMFLLVGGLWAYVRDSDRGAGLLIGAAAAVKVTPALFLIYFLYKREWRVALWIVLGGLIASLVLPALLFGPVYNARLFWDWVELMILPFVTGERVPPITTQINQSYTGMVYRLVTESPGVEHGDQEYFVNVLQLGHTAAAWIIKGLVGLTLLALAWVCRTTTEHRRDWRLACEFSLVIIAMLMLSERSWKHHYVVMVLPFASLAACMSVHVGRVWLRRTLGGIAVGAFLLMYVISSDLAELIREDVGDKYVDAFGSYVLSALAIFIGLAIVLREVRPKAAVIRSDPDPGGERQARSDRPVSED